MTLKFAVVQYLYIRFGFTITELFAILLPRCINLHYTPVVQQMNSRAIWLKELGSYYNYLSMGTMTCKECLGIFSFSLAQYLSSLGPFATNVIAVYQGSYSYAKDF